MAWTETNHNPVKLLKMLPQSSLEAAASNQVYLRHYDAVLAEFNRKVQTQVCWFSETVTAAAYSPIAYFSLEYGLHRSLPSCRPGLSGGDHVKECSDLVPQRRGRHPAGYVLQKINDGGKKWTRSSTGFGAITRVLMARGHLTVRCYRTSHPRSGMAVIVGRIPLSDGYDLEIVTGAPADLTTYISNVEERLLQDRWGSERSSDSGHKTFGPAHE
jgi:starch phosphorylase